MMSDWDTLGSPWKGHLCYNAQSYPLVPYIPFSQVALGCSVVWEKREAWCFVNDSDASFCIPRSAWPTGGTPAGAAWGDAGGPGGTPTATTAHPGHASGNKWLMACHEARVKVKPQPYQMKLPEELVFLVPKERSRLGLQ